LGLTLAGLSFFGFGIFAASALSTSANFCEFLAGSVIFAGAFLSASGICWDSDIPLAEASSIRRFFSASDVRFSYKVSAAFRKSSCAFSVSCTSFDINSFAIAAFDIWHVLQVQCYELLAISCLIFADTLSAPTPGISSSTGMNDTIASRIDSIVQAGCQYSGW
jgi:hypothetical protein